MKEALPWLAPLTQLNMQNSETRALSQQGSSCNSFYIFILFFFQFTLNDGGLFLMIIFDKSRWVIHF